MNMWSEKINKVHRVIDKIRGNSGEARLLFNSIMHVGGSVEGIREIQLMKSDKEPLGFI